MELLAENRIDSFKTAGSIFLLITGAAVILSILLQILSTCLKWKTLSPVNILLKESSFEAKIAFLQDHYLIGTALFFLLLTILTLLLFLSWKYQSPDMSGSKEIDIEVRPDG